MKQLLDLYKKVLTTGETRIDRTGVGTISSFGETLEFDISKHFPATTTKKLAFNAVKSELLWFLEGSTDERRLCEILYGTRDSSKTTIWTENANASYWKPKAKFKGDLGFVYGHQWRNFNSEGVDQITNLINAIKTNPFDRRLILNAWNPIQIPESALPPCHILAQFYVSGSGELSCQMYQRSADLFLGIPFNIASYSLLSSMLAQVTGLKPGKLKIVIGDAHIYLNHVDQVKEQLSRVPFEPKTKLWLNPEVTDILEFTMNDIQLVDYEHMGTINAPMAV